VSNKVKPVPDEGGGPTPYLAVRNAPAAIDVYKQAFGAVELMRMAEDSGKIGHAELKIGSGKIMLSDEYPEMETSSPETIGGTPVTLHLYVEDVDAVVKRAVDNGAKLLRPVEDQFYGDRAGKIADPFGHQWFLATHTEDVPGDEIMRRAKALFG
jgi:PhnB protein